MFGAQVQSLTVPGTGQLETYLPDNPSRPLAAFPGLTSHLKLHTLSVLFKGGSLR